jgi:predicted ATPase
VIPRVCQVRVRNYKSIAQAKVDLEPFTVLVGPNGAGKSNLIDSLSFIQECLAGSIELAFNNRGGIGAVRRRSTGHPTHIGIGMTMVLSSGAWADYAFEIAARAGGGFEVAHERCVVRSSVDADEEHVFEVRHGAFIKEISGIRPKVAPDRLALFAASATEEFRPVYDFLTSMRFYSIVPGRLRELQDPDAGAFLKSDGSNAAAVLKHLAARGNGDGRYERLCRLLSRIVEGLTGVEYQSVGQKETLQFKQVVGKGKPWRFDALSMSDGTLRALGLLLALYQPGQASVVAIEEPEATVHPAVMELIVGVLIDASHERQILITTHSPDILDHKDLTDSHIRVVTNKQARTLVCPLAGASRDAVRQSLYTPGELLRDDELSPDVAKAESDARQLNLFGPGPCPEAASP